MIHNHTPTTSMERFNPTEYFPEKSEKKLRKISHKKIGVSSEMCISDNTPNRYSKSRGRRKKSAEGIGTRSQNRTTIPSALSPNAHVPRSALCFKDDRPVSLQGNTTCISVKTPAREPEMSLRARFVLTRAKRADRGQLPPKRHRPPVLFFSGNAKRHPQSTKALP